MAGGVRGLDGHSMCIMRELVEGCYLDGACYELAIALHRGTGLPLVGLWSPMASGDNGVPGTWRHAAIAVDDGFADARGLVCRKAFGMPFEEPEPWDIRVITENDLRRVRPVHEHSIATAGKLAQALLPSLPWGPASHHARMRAFLDDLEALSRKHGVWIRSPYAAARPVLAEGEGDELGYDASPTADGMAIAFDRSLG